ncbi:hypothetical protein Leryth_000953 [Lithospermum erythrorhizon]|nr:hypothetical protein Leryth_000953 [Lithospermum erythrorhizon]
MGDEFVILSCVEAEQSELDEAEVINISTAEIQHFDFTSLPHLQQVKIIADQARLMQHSSYFRGLLGGKFSESSCDEILIYWNVESFLNVLRYIFGCSVDITPHNFVLLHEAGLFFGIETLLDKCQIWLVDATSSSGVQTRLLDLTSLIGIWSYSIEHANEVISQLCTSYLARNFMWMISCDSFADTPHKLLYSCIRHSDLTIESEKALCDSILGWVAANNKQSKDLSCFENGATDMLKEIRSSILPLWYAAGKRRCCLFSHYAEKGIQSILSVLRLPSISNDAFRDDDLSRLKIRLTQYTEKVDLANCLQLKAELLLLAIIPSASFSDPILTKHIDQCLDRLSLNKSDISWKLLEKTLTFESVQEVDISNCPLLHLEAATEYFGKSFPSLRSLKAAYFLNFRTEKLHQLALKCPLLREVDLTVDVSPVTSTQVTIVSTSASFTPANPINPAACESDSSMPFLYKVRFSNLTKLTLEGRTDIIDSDLLSISDIFPSLSYLNIRGCVTITDAALSVMIAKCMKLNSLLACYTSFAQSSVQSLCSSPYNISKNMGQESGRNFYSLANKLQILHIRGCKGVKEASLCQLMSQTNDLKSLCLRDTKLVDSAILCFPGSLLEELDASSTDVSCAALAHIVKNNPGLKSLAARDCMHLLCDESGSDRRESCTSLSNLKGIYSELGKSTKLEELALGWGLSFSSMVTLGAAAGTLKSLIVGLGGSLGQNGVEMLPSICPLLETLILYFQAISDSFIREVGKTMKQLRVLALCYCFGDISSLSLRFNMPGLKILKLERVTAWMTNADLVILTQNCKNLVELSLLGCRLLTSGKSMGSDIYSKIK